MRVKRFGDISFDTYFATDGDLHRKECHDSPQGYITGALNLIDWRFYSIPPARKVMAFTRNEISVKFKEIAHAKK
jgi:hypothetical protein